jgi:uroporphyrinogen decarboxylase
LHALTVVSIFTALLGLVLMISTEEVVEKTGAELEESIASFFRVEAAIGDMGIYVPTVKQSGVQHLLEYEMGVENFYYLLDDAPELVERAIDSIQRQRQRIYELLAKHIPCKTIIPVENTSTSLISPKLYRKYTLPHMQKYAETMHKYGKKAVIHMCGHLGALLPELKEVGLDGIHALTEPPVGTCTYEMALDALGEDLVVLTGFDATVMRDKNKTLEEKRQCIKDTLRPRVVAGNFSFGAGADGRVTPIEHFEMIRDAILEFGKK